MGNFLRSVRELPLDGATIKRSVDPIAEHLRAADSASFYLRLQTMGSLNSGGIREKQWLPWVSTDAARP